MNVNLYSVIMIFFVFLININIQTYIFNTLFMFIIIFIPKIEMYFDSGTMIFVINVLLLMY